MNDELLEELLSIQAAFAKNGTRLILGGGMSLYLRNRYLRPTALPRYPISIESRSTNDFDFYFTADLIVNRRVVEGVRTSLAGLGYEVNSEARNFQFRKSVQTEQGARTFRVDLLAQPPDKKDAALVELKPPRIKPKGAEGIHAYLTEEAFGLDIGIVTIDARNMIPDKLENIGPVYLPSAYNYLIMKLHAFHDRKERTDEKSGHGRHHALDIFVTVARMNEEDWSVARGHFGQHKGLDYMKRTVQIREESFAKKSSIGVIRLRENEAFRRNREAYDGYLDQLIGDLADLFPTK